MARDYRIDISFNGERRGAFGGMNIQKSNTSLNSSMYNNTENPSEISGFNLNKVVNLGLAFNIAQKANEITGSFTEKRLRQRRVNVGMTFAKYGAGLSLLGPAGLIYAVGDLGYRSVMHGIELQKKSREADYYNRLSGNNSNSNSRYRREFV